MKKLSNKIIISNVDKDLKINLKFMFIVLINENR